MKLDNEHIAILNHTAYESADGLYCGGGPEMQDLVGAGLMTSAGRKGFVPDEYFRITGLGRVALRQAGGANP